MRRMPSATIGATIGDPKGRFERVRRPRMHFLRQFETQWMLRRQSCFLRRWGRGAHGCTVCQRTEVIRIPGYVAEIRPTFTRYRVTQAVTHGDTCNPYREAC